VRNALVYLHVRCTVPSKVLSYFRTRKYFRKYESTKVGPTTAHLSSKVYFIIHDSNKYDTVSNV
jgi:hypothetical protein